MEAFLACMAMIVWFVFVASVSWIVGMLLCKIVDDIEAKGIQYIKDEHARRMSNLQATVSRPGEQFHVVERENQNANVVE